MGIELAFPRIIIFLLIFQGLTLTVDSAIDTPIKTPFDPDNEFNPEALPNTYQSGGFIKNVTSNVVNGTDTGTPLDVLQDNYFYALQIGQVAVYVVTGPFVWNSIGGFGFPAQFVIMIMTILGFIGVLYVYRLIRSGP